MTFNDRELRDTLGRFATGVTVVTTGTAPNFVGMTAQSFSSLSLDPPLVLVCVDKKASMLPLLKEAGAFTVNVLAETDAGVSNFFASSSRPAPPHQFDETPYTLGATGQPRLECATTVFDCRLHDVLEGGDHEIIIGRVEEIDRQSEAAPIIFFSGAYRTLAPLGGG